MRPTSKFQSPALLFSLAPPHAPRTRRIIAPTNPRPIQAHEIQSTSGGLLTADPGNGAYPFKKALGAGVPPSFGAIPASLSTISSSIPLCFLICPAPLFPRLDFSLSAKKSTSPSSKSMSIRQNYADSDRMRYLQQCKPTQFL